MNEERIMGALIARARWVLSFFILVSGLAFYGATHIGFDYSIDSWFLEEDPDLVSYARFLERFGADELTVIGVFGDALFTPEGWARLDALTRGAEAAPWVHRVRSLTTVEVMQDAGGFLEVGPLLDGLPQTAEAAVEARDRALANPFLKGSLIAPDGEGAAIIVELMPEGNNFDAKVAQVEALEALIAKDAAPLRAILSGSPPVDQAFLKHTLHDFYLFGPLMSLLVLLTAYGLFRRVSPTVAVFVVVMLADLWLLGVMGALGFKVNIISSALMTMILAVGIADGVHMISGYHRRVWEGYLPKEAALKSAAELLVPIFFTTATTLAGFLSLTLSNLKPIRELGFLAGIGVVFAFVASLGILPIVLPYTATPPRREHAGATLGRLLHWAGRMGPRGSRWVLVMVAILIGFSAYQIPRMGVGANVMTYFLEDDPIRLHTEEIDRRLGGTTRLEFLVETPGGGLEDPAILKRIHAFGRWTQTLPGVTGALSVADVLAELNRSLGAEGEGAALIPDDADAVAELYLLLEDFPDLELLVQDDGTVGRISARAQLSAGGELTKEVGRIEAELERAYQQDGLHISFTGFWKLMTEMENYLVASQMQSFLLAFAVVSGMMFLLLRSAWLGLFAMIPNLLPIAVGLAIMVTLGIRLDPGTAMIGCIAMGLVVDDTVHFLVHLRRHLARGLDLDLAIERTVVEAGRAITMTSLILALGFAILMLGKFAPNRNFGLVTALVVLLALVADLVALPAALRVFRPGIGRRSSNSDPG